MYESPITKYMSDIETQIREAEDGQLMYEVKQAIGFAVDKQELIKALEYDRDQYNKGYEDGLNADKWIPCSERLPEEIGTYMTTIDYGKYGKAAGQRFYHGALGWEDDCVMAWMPLPKTYEPQEGSDKE